MTAEETEEYEAGLGPRRWSWLALVGISVTVVGNVGRVVGTFADDLACRLAQHELYEEDRREFVGSVSAGIESLPEVEKVR